MVYGEFVQEVQWNFAKEDVETHKAIAQSSNWQEYRQYMYDRIEHNKPTPGYDTDPGWFTTHNGERHRTFRSMFLNTGDDPSTAWQTKDGEKRANYIGSLTQASTCRLGGHGPQHAGFVPFGGCRSEQPLCILLRHA